MNSIHTDIIKILHAVIKTFKNVSIDLIYGLPNQKLSVWEKDGI